ncbi:MAG: major capsid protein [Deltaproteobacteria bacterium]|nr:major capsid protein [Deltaproteobacteria bacterium]
MFFDKDKALPRPDLGQVAMAYDLEASQRGFIGRELFPVFPSHLQSGTYPIIPAKAFLRQIETRRAMGAAYSRSDFTFTDGNFATKEYGTEVKLDDRRRALYGAQFTSQLQAEQVSVKRGMDILLRSQESRIAALATDTTKLPHEAVAQPWSDLDNATPHDDVEAAVDLIERVTGVTPNVVALTKATFRKVFKTKAFRESDKYTRNIDTLPFEAKRRVLAEYFDVDRVLVANAIVDTAQEGEKEFIPGPVWPEDKVLVCKAATQPENLEEPCLGRTFLWKAYTPSLTVVSQYREEQISSDVFRVNHDTDECYVFTAAALVLTGVKAA